MASELQHHGGWRPQSSSDPLQRPGAPGHWDWWWWACVPSRDFEWAEWRDKHHAILHNKSVRWGIFIICKQDILAKWKHSRTRLLIQLVSQLYKTGRIITWNFLILLILVVELFPMYLVYRFRRFIKHWTRNDSQSQRHNSKPGGLHSGLWMHCQC